MAAAAAMVGGGLLSAYGQMQQGYAAKQAGEYNAQMAEMNAELTLKQAAEEETKFRSMFKRQLGDMRASVGASGVQLEGSPLEVMQDSIAQAELDATAIKTQGQRRAWALRSEAALQRYQGAAAQQGAMFGAAGSLLSAGGHAAGYYKRG